jgi:hypothetical protein
MTWDWTRRVVDHLDVHASDFRESVRFYETVLAPLGIPRDQVDAFHAAGLAAGFRSNGAPGYRDYDAGYYAAYLLDPDGNNVEALYRDVGNPRHAA